jgi:hypothetical protein
MLFILVLILKITIAFKASLLIVLLLTTLAALYFFRAFALLSEDYIDGFAVFIDKLVSFSLSVSTIGIMFRLLNWPSYKNMIIMGCITLIITFGIILYLKKKKPEISLFNQRYILRIILVCILGLVLNFTPKDKLIDIGLIKEINIENVK